MQDKVKGWVCGPTEVLVPVSRMQFDGLWLIKFYKKSLLVCHKATCLSCRYFKILVLIFCFLCVSMSSFLRFSQETQQRWSHPWPQFTSSHIRLLFSLSTERSVHQRTEGRRLQEERQNEGGRAESFCKQVKGLGPLNQHLALWSSELLPLWENGLDSRAALINGDWHAWKGEAADTSPDT